MSDSSDGNEDACANPSSDEDDDVLVGKKTRRGKQEAIYGVFTESDDEEEEERGRKGRGRRRRKDDDFPNRLGLPVEAWLERKTPKTLRRKRTHSRTKTKTDDE